MDWLIYLLVGVGVFVVLLILLALRQPDEFTIQRSILINAIPDRIFPHVNNFHRWQAWSPWDKIDPQLKRTYSGPEFGVGAHYAWSGNGKVGAGSTEIIESLPSLLIRIELIMLKPFACNNLVQFSFEPTPQGTTVTWRMSGTNKLFNKIFGLFFNLDKMVGRDFEKGLAQLKEIVERG
jgi:hypothetical protein